MFDQIFLIPFQKFHEYHLLHRVLHGVWEGSCKKFTFCLFSVNFSIGVSVLVIIRSGDEFSTAWGCKGCKIYVVLVSAGGVILITLLRIFPESDNLTK